MYEQLTKALRCGKDHPRWGERGPFRCRRCASRTATAWSRRCASSASRAGPRSPAAPASRARRSRASSRTCRRMGPWSTTPTGATRPRPAGRPPQLISLGRSAGAAIGIDFGKTHLAVAAADLSHEILAEERRELAEGYDAATGFDAAQALVAHVVEATGPGGRGDPRRRPRPAGPDPSRHRASRLGHDPPGLGRTCGRRGDGAAHRAARPRRQRREPGCARRAVLGRRAGRRRAGLPQGRHRRRRGLRVRRAPLLRRRAAPPARSGT